MNSNPKTAIVYDWVNTSHGGAEQVLLALQKIYPQADLVTSLYDPEVAKWAEVFPKVKTSFLNKIPGMKQHHRWLIWLIPLAFETLNLSKYDLVISVSSAFAKGVITKPQTLHVNYLLTPPRFLYKKDQSYQETYSLLNNPIIRLVTEPIFKYLQTWDQIAAFRPDVVIPISQVVRTRAQKIYPHLKVADPLYPTVIDSDRIFNSQNKLKKKLNKYHLIVSRLVPYKKIDLAIKACLETQQNLVIVGSGPDMNRLKNDQIKFLGSVSDQKLTQLYSQATSLLMPGEEDFGIVALEAVAHGVPVIINQNSGAAELITPHQTGLYIKKTSVSELKATLQEVAQINWQPAIMKKLVQKYQTSHFQKQFQKVINKHLT
jgi:glycosyltransferase involved in cell wall biosynthesis